MAGCKSCDNFRCRLRCGGRRQAQSYCCWRERAPSTDFPQTSEFLNLLRSRWFRKPSGWSCQPCPDFVERPLEHLFSVQRRSIQHDGIVGAPHVRRVACVAREHFGLDGRGVSADALAAQFQPRRRARSASEAVTKSFADASGKITVPISRPSNTAPRCGECALKIQQRGTDARDRGHRSRGGIGYRSAQVFPIQVGRPQCTCRGLGGGGIGRIAPGVQHTPADGTIQQASIEVWQPKRRGNPPRQRALARGGGTVDRNDRDAAHAGDRAAPTRFIRATKPGNWCRSCRHRPPSPVARSSAPSTSA